MAQTPPQHIQTFGQLRRHVNELGRMLNGQNPGSIPVKLEEIRQDVNQLSDDLGLPPVTPAALPTPPPAPPAAGGQQQQPWYQRNPWDVLKGK